MVHLESFARMRRTLCIGQNLRKTADFLGPARIDKVGNYQDAATWMGERRFG
jgi:hypothetical protein